MLCSMIWCCLTTVFLTRDIGTFKDINTNAVKKLLIEGDLTTYGDFRDARIAK